MFVISGIFSQYSCFFSQYFLLLEQLPLSLLCVQFTQPELEIGVAEYLLPQQNHR